MKDLIFEKYLYDGEERIINDAQKIAFGEDVGNGITVVESEKIIYNWTMDEINAIVYTISAFTNDKHLGSYMSGLYLGLQVILNGDEIEDFKHEDWKVLTSPKISCKKISHLKANELAPIFIALNTSRELWTNGENNDASKYFL